MLRFWAGPLFLNQNCFLIKDILGQQDECLPSIVRLSTVSTPPVRLSTDRPPPVRLSTDRPPPARLSTVSTPQLD